jgi:hypothetical protein
MDLKYPMYDRSIVSRKMDKMCPIKRYWRNYLPDSNVSTRVLKHRMFSDMCTHFHDGLTRKPSLNFSQKLVLCFRALPWTIWSYRLGLFEVYRSYRLGLLEVYRLLMPPHVIRPVFTVPHACYDALASECDAQGAHQQVDDSK